MVFIPLLFHLSKLNNVHCGHTVVVTLVMTIVTMINVISFITVFFTNGTAFWTALACISRVYFDKITAVFSCFISNILLQLIKCPRMMLITIFFLRLFTVSKVTFVKSSTTISVFGFSETSVLDNR